MRFRFSLSIVAALLVQDVPSAQAQLVSKWEKVGPVNFTALVHQSQRRIVATTDHGYLYITMDEGTTWQRQCVDDTRSLDGIAFGDSLHGALIASGSLMVTSDGGATWHMQSAPAGGSLAMVGALGADTLLIGAPTFTGDTLRGKIFRSTDAGSHWDTVFTSDSTIEYWQAPMKIMFFFGSGYAIGHNFYAKTTDGGAHWAAQYLTGDIEDIDFYDQNTGAIAATSGYYVTMDGGTRWAFTPVFHDERDDSYSTIKFFGPASFFMFGTPNAYLFTSNDLGASVSLVPMRQASSMSNVIRTRTGWLAVGGGIDPQGDPYGGGGIILHGILPPENATSLVWTVLAECPFSGAVSLHASNGAMLQCVAGSYPLVSMDSGILWHVADQHSPSYGAMHFPSPDTGYLFYTGGSPSVYGGVNLQTVDSGQSWKPLDISPGYINAATFGSSDTGYGFSGSTLIRTTDGGLHWLPDSIHFSTECPYPGYAVKSNSPQSIASPDGLHAFVTFVVMDTAIVHGGKAKNHRSTYRTTDGGVTWVGLATPTNVAINEVYFHTGLLGFITSDSGRIYRTSDGGNSWSMEQPAPFHYSFNSINFLNDRIGFLTTDTEAVLVSSDAGLSWVWLPIPTNREEIANRQFQFVIPPDTFPNNSGMSMQGIFFPDSATVLISFARALLNVTIPPKDTVINGDTIVEFTPVNQGVHLSDYGFYRAKLKIPSSSSVTQSRPVLQNDLAISTYPNPARDAIRVSISVRLPSPIHIDVLDILGKTVMSAIETNPDFSLDVQSLSNGVYTLRCMSGSESAAAPFTVTR